MKMNITFDLLIATPENCIYLNSVGALQMYLNLKH